ncbi:hypothetical protein MCOR34_011489, partial [Pyricularia oryzae]
MEHPGRNPNDTEETHMWLGIGNKVASAPELTVARRRPWTSSTRRSNLGDF